MERKSRRQVLVLCASGAMVGLAGCGGDQGDGTDGETGDGDGTDGGTGDGGDSDGETQTPTATETTQDDGAGRVARLGETSSFPESYAMTATISRNGQTIEMSGRFYQGDMYWEFEQQGQQIEWYLVGDNSYVVTQGGCFSGMMQGGMDRESVDPSAFSEQASANPDVEPAGTDTIDGEEVLVYEVSGSGMGGTDGTVTYYVLADSGYPRRIESASMQWDFHSWGAVEPVQEPDANCQSMPGSGPTATAGDG